MSSDAWAELKTDPVDDILSAVERHLVDHDWREPVDLRGVIEDPMTVGRASDGSCASAAKACPSP